MRRVAMAAVGGIGVTALVWAAIAHADEIDCDGGRCAGTQFDDTIER
jgi:hypothetical protein